MARQSTKIINNSFFVLSARIFETLAGILVVGMLARYLGLSDFGEYALVMAVVWIAQPVISMEIPRILVVELSRNMSRATGLIGTGIAWNIMIFIILALALSLVAVYHGDLPYSYFTGLFIALFLTLTQTVGTGFVAHEKMQYDTYTSLIAIFSLILFTGGAIFFDLGLQWVFVAAAVAYFCGFIASVAFNRKVTGFIPLPHLHYKTVRHLLSESLALSVVQILEQLLIYCGVFFLKYMSGNVEVALFQAPMRIFTKFMLIPLSLMLAFMPLFARLATAHEKKDELVKATQKVFKIFMILGMMITLIAYSTATEIITVIFGNAFEDSIVGFKIVVLGTIFFFINIFYVMLCMVRKKLKGYAIIKIAGFAVCFFLNMVLVPEHGYVGSVWALVLSSCVIFFAGYAFLRDLFRMESLRGMLFIILTGFGIIAALNYASSINFVVSLAAGLFCFSLVMIVSKTVTWTELSPLLNHIRRVPNIRIKQR